MNLQFVIVGEDSTRQLMAPPRAARKFCVKEQSSIVGEEWLKQYMAPPSNGAEFRENVLKRISGDASQQPIAPPLAVVEFPENIQFSTVPPTWLLKTIAPPFAAVFPVNVQDEKEGALAKQNTPPPPHCPREAFSRKVQSRTVPEAGP